MRENTFYTRLHTLAKQYNMSMNQLERELNFPRNALNNYKNNKSPSAYRLSQIARYFGVSMEYLIGETVVSSYVSMDDFFKHLNPSEKLEIYKLSHNWVIDRMFDRFDNKI